MCHPDPGATSRARKTKKAMKKLDMLTAALKSGNSVVDVIRNNSNACGLETEMECPCGTPEWEDYVAGIYADAINALKAAV